VCELAELWACPDSHQMHQLGRSWAAPITEMGRTWGFWLRQAGMLLFPFLFSFLFKVSYSKFEFKSEFSNSGLNAATKISA
jgi:hypothetical protein